MPRQLGAPSPRSTLANPNPLRAPQILDLLEHKAIFTAGYKAVLHIHSLVEECEITKLLAQVDPKTRERKKARPQQATQHHARTTSLFATFSMSSWLSMPPALLPHASPRSACGPPKAPLRRSRTRRRRPPGGAPGPSSPAGRAGQVREERGGDHRAHRHGEAGLRGAV